MIAAGLQALIGSPSIIRVAVGASTFSRSAASCSFYWCGCYATNTVHVPPGKIGRKAWVPKSTFIRAHLHRFMPTVANNQITWKTVAGNEMQKRVSENKRNKGEMRKAAGTKRQQTNKAKQAAISNVNVEHEKSSTNERFGGSDSSDICRVCVCVRVPLPLSFLASADLLSTAALQTLAARKNKP